MNEASQKRHERIDGLLGHERDALAQRAPSSDALLRALEILLEESVVQAQRLEILEQGLVFMGTQYFECDARLANRIRVLEGKLT